LIQHIEWEPIYAALQEMQWPYFGVAFLVCFVLVIPHAIRWRLVLKRLGYLLAYPEAIRLLFLGYLFNQVLPTSFGGDVVRSACLKSSEFSLTQSVHSVLIDRVFALLALSTLYVVFYPLFSAQLPPLFFWVMLLLSAILLGFALFWRFQTFWLQSLSRWPLLNPFTYLLQDFSTVLNRKDFIALFGMSLAIHLTIGFAFYWLSVGLNIGLSLWACLSLFPLINLATLIPLSFAGWGVREGVIVFVLQFFAIPAHQAFSLSVLYGSVITLIALPGFYVWWFFAKNARKDLRCHEI
jgi:uncharacterized membrane protein YbhN (UPF0104 family)